MKRTYTKRRQLSSKKRQKRYFTKKCKGGSIKCAPLAGCSTTLQIHYPVGIVQENEFSQDNTKNIPYVEFVKDPKRAYLLIMWDTDAPLPSFLHWMQLYIPSSINKIHHIKELVPYQAPTPPMGTHRYYFTIYTMDNIMSNKIIVPSKRHSFNIKQFENNYSLIKICERCMIIRAD